MEKSIVLKFVIILMAFTLINCSFLNSAPEKNAVTLPSIKKSTRTQTNHHLLAHLQHQQDTIQYPSTSTLLPIS